MQQDSGMSMGMFDSNGYIHGRLPGSQTTEKVKERNKVGRLSRKRLIASYLCHGEKSACVVKGTCSVLESCRYGQRYLELSRANHEK